MVRPRVGVTRSSSLEAGAGVLARDCDDLDHLDEQYDQDRHAHCDHRDDCDDHNDRDNHDYHDGGRLERGPGIIVVWGVKDLGKDGF